MGLCPIIARVIRPGRITYAMGMGRWEPDAQQRLVRAALDLFVDKGYDDTAVAEIAERAGLTKSTFFRHFPDKREVLFVGQDTLCELLSDGIAAAPSSATPLEAVAAALDGAAVAFTPDRRAFASQRREVIAANSELEEREALKRTRFAAAMTRALRARGVPDPAADIAAELGVLAFRNAFARWAESSNRQFGALARESLEELEAASALLT
jgi:AcrR family transcriptional regulator